jgi:hypothetical protein
MVSSYRQNAGLGRLNLVVCEVEAQATHSQLQLSWTTGQKDKRNKKHERLSGWGVAYYLYAMQQRHTEPSITNLKCNEQNIGASEMAKCPSSLPNGGLHGKESSSGYYTPESMDSLLLISDPTGEYNDRILNTTMFGYMGLAIAEIFKTHRARPPSAMSIGRGLDKRMFSRPTMWTEPSSTLAYCI